MIFCQHLNNQEGKEYSKNEVLENLGYLDRYIDIINLNMIHFRSYIYYVRELELLIRKVNNVSKHLDYED